MCSNHDQKHFPVLVREVANLLACGVPEDRDLLLQIFAYSGMEALVDEHSGCLSVDVLAKCNSRIMAERARLIVVAHASYKRIHDRWVTDASEEADDVPF